MLRLSLFSFVLFALALLLIGCGGSGGGSSTGRVVYETNWTENSAGPQGVSQKILFLDESGQIVTSTFINKTTTGIQQITVEELPKGDYHLRVELYSQPNAGGVLTGELDRWLEVNGTENARTVVGDAPTTIQVTPTSATLQSNQAQQFFANGANSAGLWTLVAPNTFTWTSLGGVVNIGSDGIAHAVSVGSGSVRATHGPSSLQGAATVNVQQFQTETSKWTVLVYMNAASDLHPFSTLNMNQMERVAGSPDNVRFVVQWKQSQELFSSSSFDGTRRYLVEEDQTSQIRSNLVQNMGDTVDMGDDQTLLDFINWGKTNYPADRYVLVIWSHGNGWRRKPQSELTRAVSYDDETGSAIQIWELPQAIGDNQFEIVAFDASLMQMMEVAYEIQDQADYVIGSEESPPGAGYPYDLVFDDFRDNPNATPAQLSKSFVDAMVEVYANTPQNWKLTQSVVETSKLPALAMALSGLAGELIAHQASLGGVIPAVRTSAQSYNASATRVYRDIWHLSDLLANNGGVPTPVQNAASAVKTALDDAVIWEGHNNQSPNSHGLSIDFSSSSQFAPVSSDYSLMRFAQDTQWNEWLQIAP